MVHMKPSNLCKINYSRDRLWNLMSSETKSVLIIHGMVLEKLLHLFGPQYPHLQKKKSWTMIPIDTSKSNIQ